MNITGKTRVKSLRPFGHIKRRNNDVIVKTVGEIRVKGNREPKKYEQWIEVIREDVGGDMVQVKKLLWIGKVR